MCQISKKKDNLVLAKSQGYPLYITRLFPSSVKFLKIYRFAGQVMPPLAVTHVKAITHEVWVEKSRPAGIRTRDPADAKKMLPTQQRCRHLIVYLLVMNKFCHIPEPLTRSHVHSGWLRTSLRISSWLSSHLHVATTRSTPPSTLTTALSPSEWKLVYMCITWDPGRRPMLWVEQLFFF